jgi:hypothetical protein
MVCLGNICINTPQKGAKDDDDDDDDNNNYYYYFVLSVKEFMIANDEVGQLDRTVHYS